MNENERVARWRRNAGPALALVAAGMVAGAILSNSVSAVAADDGGTPAPSVSSGPSADRPSGGAAEDGNRTKSKEDCPDGMGGRFEGRARMQSGSPDGGMRGGFGQAPDGWSSQAPGQTQSPTSYLTF
jgi:hypothetical protein